MLADLVSWLAYAMAHLIWLESQRAEYLADHLASRVAGTEAMLSLLTKLHLGRVFRATIDQVVRMGQRDHQALFQSFQQAVNSVPPRELLSIDRQEILDSFRLDSTHPPTSCRIALLHGCTVQRGKVVLAELQVARLERALEPLREGIEREVVDAHRAYLHYGT